MDVEGLRNELEQFLAKNPDAEAPHGFRARFNQAVQDYQAEGRDIPKSALEQELHQIRDEAEAAVKAAETDGAEAAPQRAEAAQAPAAPAGPIAAPAAAVEPARPQSGGFLAYGIGIVVAALAIAGAYYLFRR